MDDFCTVDCGAFTTLNLCAMQELADRQGGQQRLIEHLQKELESLRSQLVQTGEL